MSVYIPPAKVLAGILGVRLGANKWWHSSPGNYHCPGRGWHTHTPSSAWGAPCSEVCPALCTGHRGELWGVLLGYGISSLGCGGRLRDVWRRGLGSWVGGGKYGGRVGVPLALEAGIPGNQILEEVRLERVLFVTVQISKCRPSVFLAVLKGLYYNVYSTLPGEQGMMC